MTRRTPSRRSPLIAGDHLGDDEQEYSVAELRRLFHLPHSLLSSLARAGYTTALPAEGKALYGFRDILVFRVASALRAAKLPAAQIISAVGKLREALPPEALRDYARLDTTPASRDRRVASALAADQHYARGVGLEESDIAAARAAYLDALRSHKHHVEARVNLGRLLHLEGKLAEAEKVYREARNSSATLSYNLAVLLEDLNREDEAVAAYRQALAQDPNLHEAHYNLSRLHERARQPREALRHLIAYRRHLRDSGA